MIVKFQKKIEFINDCNCIVDYEELEKAMLWYQDKPTSRLKHIYMFGNYPAVTIFKEKIHIHRLLMMYWNGIRKIDKNTYVHHIDENKLNASKNNLMFINASLHQSKHNKGKTISDYQKEKIRMSNHLRKENKKTITKRQSAWCKRKRTEDKIYKLKGQVRCCLRDSFRRKKYKKNSNSEKIIGCEWEFFINYLLNTFKNNYGYDWDGKEKISIDHIIPLATAKTEEEVIKLCHYTNLQLLKAEDNLRKKDKLNWRI